MLGRRRAGFRSAGITLSGRRLHRWTVWGRGTAMDERPDWARRMVEERTARDWSQSDAVRALMVRLPDHQEVSEQDLLRQWRKQNAPAHVSRNTMCAITTSRCRSG